jgi:hypothetical protein
MISWDNVVTNFSGAHPDVLAINASGAGATDGTEFIAAYINNGIFGPSQAFMDYANGNANAPSGTVGTPNGVTEAAGVSQILEAIQKAHGIGPGKYVQWGLADDPSVTGDRVLLLSNQTILISSYQELVDACYVGDGNNATAAYFYKSTDSGGVTRSTSGTYFTLPPANNTYLKQYSEAAGDFTVSGGSGFSLTHSALSPYKKSTGEWWLKGSISASQASSSGANITISGVDFGSTKNAVSLSSITVGAAAARLAHTNISTAIRLTFDNSVTDFTTSFDVPLASKPTWAEDFEYILGITY